LRKILTMKLHISRADLYKAKGEIPCDIEYSNDSSLSLDSTLVEIMKSNLSSPDEVVAFSKGDTEECVN